MWAATEACAGRRGGVSLVGRVTGLSRLTIYAGLKELADGVASLLPVERVRRRGGGRPPITPTQPCVLAALEALVEPTSRGDPESPLRWNCKSVRRLATELRRPNSFRRLHAPYGETTLGSRKCTAPKERGRNHFPMCHLSLPPLGGEGRGGGRIP